MASQRFNDVGVTQLKCDHPGCQTLPAEFSDTAGLNNAQIVGWATGGQVLCPAHNPNHQAVEYNAFDYWSNRFGGVNAKSRNL